MVVSMGQGKNRYTLRKPKGHEDDLNKSPRWKGFFYKKLDTGDGLECPTRIVTNMLSRYGTT
jgi:hypothetical protein